MDRHPPILSVYFQVNAGPIAVRPHDLQAANRLLTLTLEIEEDNNDHADKQKHTSQTSNIWLKVALGLRCTEVLLSDRCAKFSIV